MKTIRFNSLAIACLFCLFPTALQAQRSRIGTWKTYLAYQEAILTTETPNRVFAVYRGAYNDGKVYNDGVLLSFSKEDNEVLTYSFREGLNDIGIAQMDYCPETQTLVLVYDNANIDLFMGKNNVYNLPNIKNETVTNKSINSLRIIGKQAYIATGFGIVVVDTERKEIKTECKLGLNVHAVCQWGDQLYAATSEGIRRAPIAANLMDKENWTPFDELVYDGDETRIDRMTVFKDRLIFHDGSNNRIVSASKEGSVNTLHTGACRQLTVLNDQLVLCLSNTIYFYTDLAAKATEAKVTAAAISSYQSKDTYWVAQLRTGLISIKKETGVDGYSLLTQGIKVDSPLRNHCFYMTYTAGKLLVVGGHVDNRNVSGTFMIYENGKWTNFDDQAIAKASGLNFNGTPWCRDFTSVAVDPRDPNHYFVGGFHDGIYEFQDTVLLKLHSYTNTNNALQTANPGFHPELYVRAASLAFDRNNNLYVANAEAQNGLSVLTADRQWASFYYPDIAKVWTYQLFIDRNNFKWINKYRASIGVWVLDDNNTMDNPSDDTAYHSSLFRDQQDRTVNATTYSCIAEDLDGTIWVGTDIGPITFTSPAQVGEGLCTRIVSTDQQNTGFYVMENQRVTAIAIDGGNRKWIGTGGEGVFILENSEGNWTVENFNTRNSNLISDNITAIAINHDTGEVFIGTDKGLVSYMGDAVKGAPDYSNIHAYPNPVDPRRNSLVTISGLVGSSDIKITDIAGNLVNRGVSKGGQYSWNCTNAAGAAVKAGIYLVFATLPDGSQGVVTKIMVLK
ncbi:MAG: hypothetical protein LBH61_07090 [Dysgonamonadaceae bacterium]|jgi:hypothetical protein|nr:hypothetical protein [Dysgonamonadaceae bacterium]